MNENRIESEASKPRRPFFVVGRILLSFFVLYHVVGVFLAPNVTNYIKQTTGWVFEPYLNTFGLGSTWRFFAPNPGPPPLYVDYEWLDKDGNVITEGRYPEDNKNILDRIRNNRRIGMMKVVMQSETQLDHMLGRYFCLQNEGVSSVRFWGVSLNVPSLSSVAEGQRVIGDDVQSIRNFMGEHVCSKAGSV